MTPSWRPLYGQKCDSHCLVLPTRGGRGTGTLTNKWHFNRNTLKCYNLMQISVCIKISKFILHACSNMERGNFRRAWDGWESQGWFLNPISRSFYSVWRGLQSEKDFVWQTLRPWPSLYIRESRIRNYRSLILPQSEFSFSIRVFSWRLPWWLSLWISRWFLIQ